MLLVSLLYILCHQLIVVTSDGNYIDMAQLSQVLKLEGKTIVDASVTGTNNQTTSLTAAEELDAMSTATASSSTAAVSFTATSSSASSTYVTTNGTTMLTTRTIYDARQHSPNDSKLFYMYELDEELWWRWPDPEADCSQSGYLEQRHAELSGMGSPIRPDDGLFLTWHGSLFSALFNRLKRSSRRTRDPEKASIFIIPYDLAMDGYVDPTVCKTRRSCTHGNPEKVQQVVQSMKYFDRYQGGDHVVLWSLGQYHPWPHNHCDMFMRDFCARCTFTCYWMDPTKANNRFVSVPFSSSYHWWDGIKDLPWAVQADSPTARYVRNMTAVYLGSTQTLNPAHTKIRRAMTAQCNASTECHWLQIKHSSTDGSIADLLSIYRKSTFCLCPPGDDPARKAVFDSILSGCIPVIFEVATLYNQYPWHLGEQAALDISVNIPGDLVRSGELDFMSVLLSIPKDVIRKKQEVIALYAPRMQYALPPPALLKNRSDETPWDPPFKDGVEVLLDGLFERTGRVVRNESTDIPHRLMQSREWSREYGVVKVNVPGGGVEEAVLGDGTGGTDSGGGGGGSGSGSGSDSSSGSGSGSGSSGSGSGSDSDSDIDSGSGRRHKQRHHGGHNRTRTAHSAHIGHSHGHSNSHGHSHKHNHGHSRSLSHSDSHSDSRSHSHSHSHHSLKDHLAV